VVDRDDRRAEALDDPQRELGAAAAEIERARVSSSGSKSSSRSTLLAEIGLQ
jgi:hypothetical protein